MAKFYKKNGKVSKRRMKNVESKISIGKCRQKNVDSAQCQEWKLSEDRTST